MRTWTMTVAAGVLVIAAALAAAQPPGGPGPAGSDDLVTRMMAFDQDKDGKLTRAEVTDARLHPLFDRADADKDGTVTGPELNVLMVQERAKDRGGPPGFGPRGGGPGGPPAIGQVLPGFLQDRLNLTAAQKEQVAELQKEVDSKLANILTDEQKKTLQEMRERGPGRGGPPGGRPGGPGGPPGGPGGRPGGPPPGEQP